MEYIFRILRMSSTMDYVVNGQICLNDKSYSAEFRSY